MENLSGATGIGVNDLLLARGIGGGYGGGGFLGSGGYGGAGYGCNSFANPSSNAVRIDRNADVASERSSGDRSMFRSGLDAMRDQFDTAERSRELDRINDSVTESSNHGSDQRFRSELRSSDQLAGVLSQINAGDVRNADQRFQTELRTNDRLLALQAEMNENARKAADCCCDLKLKACEDKSEVLAAIAASEGRGIERELNAANNRVTQLETINSITQRCGCCSTSG